VNFEKQVSNLMKTLFEKIEVERKGEGFSKLKKL